MKWFKKKEIIRIVLSNINNRNMEYANYELEEVNAGWLWKEYIKIRINSEFGYYCVNFKGLSDERKDWLILGFMIPGDNISKLLTYYIERYNSKERPIFDYKDYIRLEKIKRIIE